MHDWQPSLTLAESQGFEPWKPYGLLVFETSSLDHSDNSPCLRLLLFYLKSTVCQP